MFCLVTFLLLCKTLADFIDFSTNILLFIELLEKLTEILKWSDDLLINSEFGTLLKDLRLDDKYIASSNDVLPTLFSPQRTVMFLENEMLNNEIDRKF